MNKYSSLSVVNAPRGDNNMIEKDDQTQKEAMLNFFILYYS